MPAHSRSKNGVASVAYVPGIHTSCMRAEIEAWMAGTSPAMTKQRRAFSDFPDPKRQQLFVLAAIFERIAGLPQKIWNIDP